MLNPYDAVRCILAAKGSNDVGRTAIQKMVYLAQNAMPNAVEPVRYSSHYYGPFSSELGVVLEKLVAYSFVAETQIHGKIYEGYKYDLTERGHEIIKRIRQDKKAEYNQIKQLVEKCSRFCQLKAAPLAFASKVMYIEKSERKQVGSFDAVVEYAKDLGWDITPDEVKNGIELLNEINGTRS